MLKSFSVAMLFLAAFLCGQSFAQSTITGGQGSYIYVDGQSGSDANPGTSAKPLKTIQAGVDAARKNNAAGVATVVSINAGVYREAVTMGGTKTSAPITIEAAAPGTVYIDGADVLTNSSQISSSVYAYPWKDTVQGCKLPNNWYTGMPPIILANEMVFVNGQSLTQVMSKSQLEPGTFYVNDSYDEIDVDPAPGTDMSSAKVEASARRTTLTLNGVSNVVLKGLVLQHAASCINVDGANINSGSNILIDNVQANWNNWGALGVNGSDHVTVQNSTASYNGGVGFASYQDTDSLFANNESDYNNRRGEMVGMYDFAQGGFKLMYAQRVKVTGQKSYNNGAQGLWFDTDNKNITVSGAKLAGNTINDLQLELNPGPITVENSSFCGGDVGVNLLENTDTTLIGNHFYGSGGPVAAQNAQLYLGGKKGGRTLTDYVTGVSINEFTSNITLKDNTFTAVGANQYVFNTYLSGDDWSRFINTVNSSDNLWYNAANSKAFGLGGGQNTDLAGWKSASGDSTSSWSLSAAAQSGCGIPAPAYPDFNLFAHNNASYISNYKMSLGALSIPLQVKSFGFGSVTLSAPDLPSGVVASFSPATLVSGQSVLALTAYSNAKAETLPITVFATSGSRVHTITLNVTIVPGTRTAPPPATPELIASPSTVYIAAPGSAGATTLRVSGFDSSAFKYSCSGLPKGAACVFGSLMGSGSSGTLSLKITTAAPSTAKLVTPGRRGSGAMLALALPGLIAILGLFGTRRRYSQWNRTIALLLIVSTGLFLSACGVAPGLGGNLVAANSGGGSGSGSSGSSGTSGSSSGSGSGSSSGGTGTSGSGSSGSSSTGTSGSGSSGSGTGTSGSGSSGTSSSSGSGSGTASGSGGSSSGTGTSGSTGSSGSTSGSGTSSGSGSGSSTGSGSGSAAPSNPGTPTGTSTIKVTAVSGTQSAAVTLTLKVQ